MSHFCPGQESYSCGGHCLLRHQQPQHLGGRHPQALDADLEESDRGQNLQGPSLPRPAGCGGSLRRNNKNDLQPHMDSVRKSTFQFTPPPLINIRIIATRPDNKS